MYVMRHDTSCFIQIWMSCAWMGCSYYVRCKYSHNHVAVFRQRRCQTANGNVGRNQAMARNSLPIRVTKIAVSTTCTQSVLLDTNNIMYTTIVHVHCNLFRYTLPYHNRNYVLITQIKGIEQFYQIYTLTKDRISEYCIVSYLRWTLNGMWPNV